MSDQTFTIMVGNVGSGKSTYAAKMVVSDPNVVVVSRDAIVTMIAGGIYKRYDTKKKNLYLQTEKALILSALSEGFSVIIDRTNGDKKRRGKYIAIVGGKAKILCCDFGPGSEEGMRRRMSENRGRSPETWEKVHREIREEYEEPTTEEGIDLIIKMSENQCPA